MQRSILAARTPDDRTPEQELLSHLAMGNLASYQFAITMYFRPFQRDTSPWRLGTLDEHVLFSQEGEYLPQALGWVGYALKTVSPSEIELVKAAAILQNAAWHKDAELGRIVEYAGKFLNGKYPTLAQEHAADALKNATHFPGGHIDGAINYAVNHGLTGSPRIRSACVRTISNAAEHSARSLQTEKVMEFLEKSSRDKNDFTSATAIKAYEVVFGKLRSSQSI